MSLTGRALVDGQPIVRPVVPAENMLQAFAYRHLVPVSELKVVAAERTATNMTPSVLNELPLKVPAGGNIVVRMGMPGGTTFDQIRLELDEPPEGLSIENEPPSARGSEVLLTCDAAKVKPGLKGNLLVNAFAVKTEETTRAKPQPRGRPVPLGMLPAIPFEIIPANVSK